MIRISVAMALVLDALGRGHAHGFEILDMTGLPSGTVYPILRRLEHEGLAGSKWESARAAQEEQRPPRRNYTLTRAGRVALEQARERFPMLAALPAHGKLRRT